MSSKSALGASSPTFKSFKAAFTPLESPDALLLLTDYRTDALFCECHIKASKLISLGTTDVPLDPEDQADYRARAPRI